MIARSKHDKKCGVWARDQQRDGLGNVRSGRNEHGAQDVVETWTEYRLGINLGGMGAGLAETEHRLAQNGYRL